MEVKLDKMICNLSCPKELSPLIYFKQFNIYKNIKLPYKNKKICDVKATNPNISILSTKLIDTEQGTSLDGQNLTGKKLIVLGNIDLNLIINYNLSKNKYNYINNKQYSRLNKSSVLEVNMPFSTFIIIPNDDYGKKKINLRYLVEDVTAIYIAYNKVFVSVTILIQYLDEY